MAASHENVFSLEGKLLASSSKNRKKLLALKVAGL
jgi:hypothetical protein